MKFDQAISMAIPLVSSLCYCLLLILALKIPRNRTARIFISYLLLMLVWSFSSFMMRTGIYPGPLAWNRIMVCGMAGVPFTFFSFAIQITGRTGLGFAVRLGYAFSVLFVAANLLGLIVSDAYLAGGSFQYVLGPAAPFFALTGGTFILFSAVLLIRETFRDFRSFWSNRLVYPSLGAVLMMLGSWLNLAPFLGQYPLDIAANTINAFLIAYAIYRHHFLNITITIRKGLVYSILTVLLTGSYLLIVLLIEQLIRWKAGYTSLIVALPMAVLVAALFEPLKESLKTLIDKAFMGQQYDFRKTLTEFSHIMTSILDLEELAGSLLELLSKALQTSSCLLFLPDRDGNFYTYKAGGKNAGAFSGIRLDKTNPIIRWLSLQKEPLLTREEIELKPEFKGLWESEKEELEDLKAQVLVGIKMQNELIGVLLLSAKESGNPFTDEDYELLTTLANEAAVAIKNARAYGEAKTEAVKDELTGLFNYRFFQDFLDKEIARSKKTGQVFSLILMDIDFFKTYNDIHGHLAGDAALAKMGETIRRSIRASDVAARYGGDEFAVILPDADAPTALSAAERIRRNFQKSFRGAGYESMLLTVSMGVASYPQDARTKQQLLSFADRALYLAKNQGRNRICLYSAEIADTSSAAATIEKAAETEADFLKKQIEDTYLATVYTLAAVINARDNYTYKHSEMVTLYAIELAKALKLSEEKKEMVRLAAMLHDIGKIGTPEYILNKPGPLTPDEREIVQRHVSIAEAIINQMPFLRRVAPIILHHHEAFDGSGYPHRLRGEEIPFESRILAIADAFHAMTSDRPYRQAMKTEEAIEQLRTLAGKQFDPHLVPVFVKLIENKMINTITPALKNAKNS
jgi:diguanylate cyclase (GGDEF)-like protein/putative nucleotidyltransferase with HDIG domain